MVPSGPTFAVLEKMADVSIDENNIRFAKTITSTRCYLVRDPAEGTVFNAWDNESIPLWINLANFANTTVNFANTADVNFVSVDSLARTVTWNFVGIIRLNQAMLDSEAVRQMVEPFLDSMFPHGVQKVGKSLCCLVPTFWDVIKACILEWHWERFVRKNRLADPRIGQGHLSSVVKDGFKEEVCNGGIDLLVKRLLVRSSGYLFGV